MRMIDMSSFVEVAPESPSLREAEIPHVIVSPESLLQPLDQKSTVAQTVHINTLFSEGCVNEAGEVCAEVLAYLDGLKENGITHLYAIGLWRASVFSELVMPYWARRCWPVQPDPSTLGPSCFSIQSYEPNDQIGSWENLATFIDVAGERGINVVADYVTNTVGLDSEIAFEQPELIEGEEVDSLPEYLELLPSSEDWQQVFPEEDASSEKTTAWDGSNQQHSLSVYRQSEKEVIVYNRIDTNDAGEIVRTHKVYLEQSQGEDLFPRTTAYSAYVVSEEGGSVSVHKLNVGRQGDNTPGDLMADTLMLDYSKPETVAWGRELIGSMLRRGLTVRADLAQLKPVSLWKELTQGVNTDGKLWAEVYGDFVQYSEVMDRLYYAWVAKSLRKGDVAEIMDALRNRSAVQEMLEHALYFLANHDELAELSPLQLGAAMAIISSMPGGLLLAQGQIEGIIDTRFSADYQISLPKYLELVNETIGNDGEYFHFMTQLAHLWARPVFRSPHSEVKEPHIEIKSNGQSHSLDDSRYNGMFRTARQLGEDRVITIVNFQDPIQGEEIAVTNIAELFGLEENVQNYCLVNLLTGEVANNASSLVLRTSELGHDVHMYAVVEKRRIAEFSVNEP